MEKNLMNCKHKLDESCPNFYHQDMQSIIKQENTTPNSAGFVNNSKYELANKLCEKCDHFE